jgi:hypothetical protein
MDLFVIMGGSTNPTYMPTDLIEGYSSLVWTERYSEPGEFELVTPKISQMMALLPMETQLTIRGSREIMAVESHNIDVDEDGVPQLTVKGRSLYAILLENRARITSETVTAMTWDANNPIGQMVELLINAAIHPPGLGAVDWSPYDEVPNITVTDNSTSTAKAGAMDYWTPGDIYTSVLGLMGRGDMGLKMVRPNISGNNAVIEIYNGLNRTIGQSTNDKVIFRYDVGDVGEAAYLRSNKDYKNVAYVTSPLGFLMVEAPNVPSNIQGRSRRVLQVNSNVSSTQHGETKNETLTRIGLRELAKHNKRAWFTGQISEKSIYKFKTHYNLGDTITLAGEYGFRESMVVSEYIRTEDEQGERAFRR